MSTSITSPQRLRDSGEPHEYVVSLTDRQACALRHIAHERVIRCRDCRFSTFEACVGDHIGHGTCRRAPVGPAHLVQFSGFCSQAEPKEES